MDIKRLKMIINIKKIKSIYLSILLITINFTFIACGGNDKKTSIDSSINQSNTKTITGKAVDGYISGATVCIDFNENDICDSSEPSVITSNNGTYSLSTDLNGTYPIIMTGGVDESTGEDFEGTLKDIVILDKNITEITSIISPLTTVAVNVYKIEKDNNLDYKFSTAQQIVASSLGLSIQQIKTDPMKDINVFLKVQQVIQTTQLISANIDINNSNKSDAFNHVLKSMSNTIAASNNQIFDTSKIIEDITKIKYNEKLIVIDDNTTTFINSYALQIKEKISSVENINMLNSMQNGLNIYKNKAINNILKKDTSTLEQLITTIKTTTNNEIIENGDLSFQSNILNMDTLTPPSIPII